MRWACIFGPLPIACRAVVHEGLFDTTGRRVGNVEASQHWLESANELGKAGLRIHELADGARTQEQQGEVNQALMWALTAAVLAFSRMDPDYPEWTRSSTAQCSASNNNDDNVYLITRIRGANLQDFSSPHPTSGR